MQREYFITLRKVCERKLTPVFILHYATKAYGGGGRYVGLEIYALGK